MAHLRTKHDYYAILAVSENASLDVVKKSYRALALTWHPDKNPGNAEATAKFQLIAEAYETIQDPIKRRDYDVRWRSLKSNSKAGKSTATSSGPARGGGGQAPKQPGKRPQKAEDPVTTARKRAEAARVQKLYEEAKRKQKLAEERAKQRKKQKQEERARQGRDNPKPDHACSETNIRRLNKTKQRDREQLDAEIRCYRHQVNRFTSELQIWKVCSPDIKERWGASARSRLDEIRQNLQTFFDMLKETQELLLDEYRKLKGAEAVLVTKEVAFRKDREYYETTIREIYSKEGELWEAFQGLSGQGDGKATGSKQKEDDGMNWEYEDPNYRPNEQRKPAEHDENFNPKQWSSTYQEYYTSRPPPSSPRAPFPDNIWQTSSAFGESWVWYAYNQPAPAAATGEAEAPGSQNSNFCSYCSTANIFGDVKPLNVCSRCKCQKWFVVKCSGCGDFVCRDCAALGV